MAKAINTDSIRRIILDIRADPSKMEAGLTKIDKLLGNFNKQLDATGQTAKKSSSILDNFFKAYLLVSAQKAVENLDRLRGKLDDIGKTGMQMRMEVEDSLTRIGLTAGRGSKNFAAYEGRVRQLAGRWRMSFDDMAKYMEKAADVGGVAFSDALTDINIGLDKFYDVSFSVQQQGMRMSKSYTVVGSSLTRVRNTAMAMVKSMKIPKSFVGDAVEATLQAAKMQKVMGLSDATATRMNTGMTRLGATLGEFYGDLKQGMSAVTKAQQGYGDLWEQLQLFQLGLAEFPEQKMIGFARVFGSVSTGLEVVQQLGTDPLQGFKSLTEFFSRLNPQQAQQKFLMIKAMLPEFADIAEMAFKPLTKAQQDILAKAGAGELSGEQFLEEMRATMAKTTAGGAMAVQLAKENAQWVEASALVGAYRKNLDGLVKNYEETAKMSDWLYNHTGKVGRALAETNAKLLAFQTYGVRALLGGGIGARISGLVEVGMKFGPLILSSIYALKGVAGIVSTIGRWVKGIFVQSAAQVLTGTSALTTAGVTAASALASGGTGAAQAMIVGAIQARTILSGGGMAGLSGQKVGLLAQAAMMKGGMPIAASTAGPAATKVAAGGSAVAGVLAPVAAGAAIAGALLAAAAGAWAFRQALAESNKRVEEGGKKAKSFSELMKDAGRNVSQLVSGLTKAEQSIKAAAEWNRDAAKKSWKAATFEGVAEETGMGGIGLAPALSALWGQGASDRAKVLNRVVLMKRAASLYGGLSAEAGEKGKELFGGPSAIMQTLLGAGGKAQATALRALGGAKVDVKELYGLLEPTLIKNDQLLKAVKVLTEATQENSQVTDKQTDALQGSATSLWTGTRSFEATNARIHSGEYPTPTIGIGAAKESAATSEIRQGLVEHIGAIVAGQLQEHKFIFELAGDLSDVVAVRQDKKAIRSAIRTRPGYGLARG